MSKRMQKYREELKLICNCSPDTRKLLFSKGSCEFIKEYMKWVFTYLFVYKNQYTFHLEIDRKKPELKILNTAEVIPPQR